MKKLFSFKLIFLAALPYLAYSIAIFFMKMDVAKNIDTMVIKLDKHWKMHWGDIPVKYHDGNEAEFGDLENLSWKDIDWPASPLKKENNFAWIKTNLPENNFESPVLAIWGVLQEFELFINGKKYYQSINIDSVRSAQKKINKYNLMKWYTIPLPQECSNLELLIRIYSENRHSIGILDGSVYLGSSFNIHKYFLIKNITYIFPGYFYIILGFLSFITFIIRIKQRPFFVITFGLFAFIVGILLVFFAPIVQLIMNSPTVYYFMCPLSLYLFPVALFAFFEQIIHKHKIIFRLFWIAHLSYAVGAVITDFLFDTTLFFNIQYFAFLFIAGIVISNLIILVGAAIHKGEMRIFAFGTTVLVITGLIETLSQARIIPGDIHIFQLGVFCFVLSLFFILERRFTKSQEDLEMYSKELEEKNLQLEEYSKNMEEKVSERTRELRIKNGDLENTLKKLRETQAQLVQSKKMASLGQLVAGIAHEINNPVGAVKSAADVVTRCIDKINNSIKNDSTSNGLKTDQSFLKALKLLTENNSVIVTAGDRIAQIVRTLKNFARLDERDFQKADIHEGINSTLTLLHHELKRRIEVIKEFGEIPKINCFPNELNQVFMNLLANSIQAIENKGTIHIKTYLKNEKVFVEISDTGKGISQKNIDSIFDPGFTTKGVGVGTGLGLSISYNIIQKHHGDIRVESEVGKGTTFTIILPTNL